MIQKLKKKILKKSKKIGKKRQKKGEFGPILRKNAYFMGLLGILWNLNVLDGIGTIYGIESGYAYEANPVMAAAYGVGPLFFFFSKYFMVSTCLAFFAHGRNYKITKVLTSLLLPLYLFVCGIHVSLFIYVKFIN